MLGGENRALVKEVSQRFKTIVVGDDGVQRFYIHGVQEAFTSHSVFETEVSKDLDFKVRAQHSNLSPIERTAFNTSALPT